MNCTSFSNGKSWELVTGQDGNCKLYQLKYVIINPAKEGEIITPHPGKISIYLLGWGLTITFI